MPDLEGPAYTAFRYPLDSSGERVASLRVVGPGVADTLDSLRQISYRERLWVGVAAFDLLPGARRRHRCARLRPNRVGGGKSGAVAVAPGVDVDAVLAVGLAELLRQPIGVTRHQRRAD